MRPGTAHAKYDSAQGNISAAEVIPCELQAVEDATGREDMIEALRNTLLVRTAASLGYNKIARGDNATRIAARVIAMSAKGAGFALPGCIQYFDRR